MEQLFPDIGHQVVQDYNHWKKGNEWDEFYTYWVKAISGL